MCACESVFGEGDCWNLACNPKWCFISPKQMITKYRWATTAKNNWAHWSHREARLASTMYCLPPPVFSRSEKSISEVRQRVQDIFQFNCLMRGWKIGNWQIKFSTSVFSCIKLLTFLVPFPHCYILLTVSKFNGQLNIPNNLQLCFINLASTPFPCLRLIGQNGH